jgi:hypothetical protein
MAGWLGVVSAEHVARGVHLGIAQTNHGKRSGLARMHPGDWLVYYSPQQRLGERSPVQAFTAIGEIADDHIWQADEGCFKPWRRAVRYRPDAVRVPIATLHGSLDLTAARNWGYQLRRGLLTLTDRDLATLRNVMTGDDVGPAQPVPNVAERSGLW